MAIYLFTDFGSADLYLGQVKAVLHRLAPAVAVIDLCNDVPNFNVESGAHLLSALLRSVEVGDVVLAVVDPGVGGARSAAVIKADGRWLVGPDNGLLSVAAQRSNNCQFWHITWRPAELSSSFHGRDLFAPVAAEIANGQMAGTKWIEMPGLDHALSPRLEQIIYIDHYGNCITSLLGEELEREATLHCGKTRIVHAKIFEEGEIGRPFWYVNSLGLVELAIKQGNAALTNEWQIGSEVLVLEQTQPS